MLSSEVKITHTNKRNRVRLLISITVQCMFFFMYSNTKFYYKVQQSLLKYNNISTSNQINDSKVETVFLTELKSLLKN